MELGKGEGRGFRSVFKIPKSHIEKCVSALKRQQSRSYIKLP